MGEKTRRLKKIKSYLQGFLDEMVWRIENRNIEQKRNYLVEVLNIDNWQKYVKRLNRLKRKREIRQVGATNPQNIAEEMMLEINDGHSKLKKKLHTSTEYTEDEDGIEERRKIFGEEQTQTQN